MIHILLNPFESVVLPTNIVESKSLTSMDARQDDIRQAVIDAGFGADPRSWKKVRRASSSQYKKDFDKLQEDLHRVTIDYTRRFQSGEISLARWRDWVRHLLRESYKKAFKLGLYSAGVKEANVDVASFDREWLRTAIKHEMEFFNKLLREIASGTQRGAIEERLKAYSDALANVFFSGRILGTPTNHLIDWTGPNDRSTCKSCRFLIEQSPYTKGTLPTVPRSGDCKCLHNCRCKLLVREVDPKLFEVVDSRQRSKSWYSEKLRRLKQGKTL